MGQTPLRIRGATCVLGRRGRRDWSPPTSPPTQLSSFQDELHRQKDAEVTASLVTSDATSVPGPAGATYDQERSLATGASATYGLANGKGLSDGRGVANDQPRRRTQEEDAHERASVANGLMPTANGVSVEAQRRQVAAGEPREREERSGKSEAGGQRKAEEEAEVRKWQEEEKKWKLEQPLEEQKAMLEQEQKARESERARRAALNAEARCRRRLDRGQLSLRRQRLLTPVTHPSCPIRSALQRLPQGGRVERARSQDPPSGSHHRPKSSSWVSEVWLGAGGRAADRSLHSSSPSCHLLCHCQRRSKAFHPIPVHDGAGCAIRR